MRREDQLTVTCPDCGCELTLDKATGQVLFHRSPPKAPAGGQDFDRLLAGLDASKERAEDVF